MSTLTHLLHFPFFLLEGLVYKKAMRFRRNAKVPEGWRGIYNRDAKVTSGDSIDGQTIAFNERSFAKEMVEVNLGKYPCPVYTKEELMDQDIRDLLEKKGFNLAAFDEVKE